jgi:hypothetical protein
MKEMKQLGVSKQLKILEQNKNLIANSLAEQDNE